MPKKSKDMAKEIEKKTARILFVEQGKSYEEIASQVGVNPRTVERWARDNDWKKIRDAKANSGKQRIERTQLVVDSLTDERLRIIAEIKQVQSVLADESDEQIRKDLQNELLNYRKQCASIDDSIAKWNKRVENLNKETKVTLSMYIEVMEMVFEALRIKNESLYIQTLDFQEEHLNEIASRKF